MTELPPLSRARLRVRIGHPVTTACKNKRRHPEIDWWHDSGLSMGFLPRRGARPTMTRSQPTVPTAAGCPLYWSKPATREPARGGKIPKVTAGVSGLGDIQY